MPLQYRLAVAKIKSFLPVSVGWYVTWGILETGAMRTQMTKMILYPQLVSCLANDSREQSSIPCVKLGEVILVFQGSHSTIFCMKLQSECNLLGRDHRFADVQ